MSRATLIDVRDAVTDFLELPPGSPGGYEPPNSSALNRKTNRPDLAASATARRRFAREAKAAASVLHDNVIAIHCVAEANGLPYLVMPYLRGESLARRLARHGSLGVTEALTIGIQVSDGLAAAHDQGLIHRDVKPSNIILDSGVERLKLTDFGLARAADASGVTRTGTLAGTPEFMSPEQARGEPVDFRSDLFSLGIVLYMMTTGRSPFRTDSCYGVIRRIVEFEPPPVCTANPGLPVWFGKVVARLMAKDPDRRYRSAHELSSILRQSLAHTRSPANRLPPELCEPTRRPLSRFLVTTAAVVTIAAAVGTASWWSRDQTDTNGHPVHPHPSRFEPSILRWDDEVENSLDSARRRAEAVIP